MHTFKLSNEKKEHLISTALQLFDQFGFQNISVNRIISDSKIAKKSFYKAFPSKDEFISECLDVEVSQQKDSLLKILDKHDKNDHRKILQSIYQWHLQQRNKEIFTGTLLSRAVIEYWNIEEIQRKVQAFHTWKYEIIFNYLREAVDNEVTLRILVSGLEGMLLPGVANILSWEEIQNLFNY